ncbi:MAG: sel1 repeat family protein [Flavobacteriales bacterium]|nr:sel1 repeat family protein [Flavobacteriales bacterium]
MLRKADEEGDAEAAYALGTWHLFGKHVPLDARVAARYLKRATDRNFPDAAYDLAVSHEKGVGVPKDLGKAFSLYMKAALLGDQQAMYEVGRCFYWGVGTEKDRDAARVWFDAYDRDRNGPDQPVKRRRVRRTPIKVS